MMFNQKTIIDEVSKKLNDSFAGFAHIKSEIEEKIRNHLESYLKEMNFVGKEEFAVVKEMLAESRKEQDKLLKRIKLLEKKIAYVAE